MADIRCPVESCSTKFRIDREHNLDRIQKDLQHHLYMRHSMAVLQSHEVARHVIAQQEKEKPNGRSTTAS